MFRALHLPYTTLRQLWQAELGYFSEDEARRVYYFGKAEDPELARGAAPIGSSFGSYKPSIIKNPQKKLETLYRKMRARGDDVAPVERIIDVSKVGTGRRYDAEKRIYMRGYEDQDSSEVDEQWFVRLPKLALDAWENKTTGFPEVGDKLHLMSVRDEASEEYVVSDANDYRIATCTLYLRRVGGGGGAPF